ncbi:hypothetical protein [Saccharothrix yanglingensis]|uniref:Uncharacterized protein n=1 Tax=Saccharothrix yanglingensis TaxID=659496 RepID=A0ABU0X3R4_9PSEU|nr:hypothetical protein [Saccharothrix yanglingensis]MDQ2586777.1 hypothetical protein [Saccharothrix yanglingensis]
MTSNQPGPFPDPATGFPPSVPATASGGVEAVAGTDAVVPEPPPDAVAGHGPLWRRRVRLNVGRRRRSRSPRH